MSAPRAVVVTVSDGVSAGTRDDVSGRACVRLLEEAGFSVTAALVPDEQDQIEAVLRTSAANAELVVTTGGTGFSVRDVTPEATRAVIEREAPGLAEAMRAAGRITTPFADLSRGVTGIRGGTVVVNVPGSPAGAAESLEAILPVLSHAIEHLAGHTEHTRSTT